MSARRRTVVWAALEPGPSELAWARDAIADQVDIVRLVVESPRLESLPRETFLGDGSRSGVPVAAIRPVQCPPASGEPFLTCFAVDRPGRWDLATVVGISRQYPLARLVSVSASLADGQRRSGPPLPGITDLPWHDLPGQLTSWLVTLDAGLPGTLWPPPMARREDRWLEERGIRTPVQPPHERPPSLAVVAPTPAAAESLKELLARPNETGIRQDVGRPDVNDPASVLVWDVGDLGPRELEWLRLLSASRPSRRIILLLSFPRGDVAHTARQAGAAAVLGRPVDREVLWGTILRLESGLSAPHLIR